VFRTRLLAVAAMAVAMGLSAVTPAVAQVVPVPPQVSTWGIVSGFAEGAGGAVWSNATGAAHSVVDLGKGTYHFATDGKYRWQTWDGVSSTAQSVKDGTVTVLTTDPRKTWNSAVEGVGTTVDGVSLIGRTRLRTHPRGPHARATSPKSKGSSTKR